jgi:cytochrome c553
MIRHLPAAVALLALAGCSSSPEPAVEPARFAAPRKPAAPLTEQMFSHFAAVSALQRAIAHGQLDTARRHARWLLDHDEPVLDGWQPFVDEMRAATRELLAAGDLPTAGALAGRLGRACSRCHEARGAVVAFPWDPEPADTPRLPAQMRRHQWAAARLWEGLVGPSDELWAQGTRTLSTMKLDAALISGGLPRGDVSALAGKVREITGRAAALTDQDERRTLYGELLSTCAGCHALVRRHREASGSH